MKAIPSARFTGIIFSPSYQFNVQLMETKTARTRVLSKNKSKAGKATTKKAPKARKVLTDKKQQKKEAKEDLDKSYNEFKEFEGRQYMGMKIGRSHRWNYDQGDWTETKITPDLWQISYAVTKRRKGRAPEGSGVPVGTEYHWYILAHQNVRKLNANDYTTSMTGLKYKLAHKRANKEKWSTSAKTQRRRLVNLLKTMIDQLESEPIPLKIQYGGHQFTGEAIPIPQTCHDGACEEWEITLNDDHLGVLRQMKSGWKLEGIEDRKLIKAIGEAVAAA